MQIAEKAQANFSLTQKLRRDLHRNPELGYKEFRTANLIFRTLKDLGYDVTEKVGVTGVVGILDTGRPGKTLTMRFDMDALPVKEENSFEFASCNPGVMHACGHDGHVAIGLTVAKILSEEANGLNGRIMMLFQPAEEGFGKDTGMTCGGAEAMIADGVLERYQPDAAVAVHLWNEYPTGHVVIHPGALMAGADLVTITVHGKGGHGALPNLAVDPLIAAAQILINLQTIVSRNVSPFETVVVSMTEFHAGETLNVIPSEALLRGTMRTFAKDARQLVMKRIEEISTSIAGGLGCKAEVEIKQIAPAVVNDAAITAEIIQSVQRHNPTLVINQQFKVMVSEDMAFFLEKVPGCYILVGAAGPAGSRVESHHHPKFDFDEQAMSHAAALLVGYANDYLA